MLHSFLAGGGPADSCLKQSSQRTKGRIIFLSEFHKKYVFLNIWKVIDKTIINIFTPPDNWLKHTVFQWGSTVASTALCRVAPRCSRRTANFCPPLGTLTSIQNLGDSWFSPHSIDLHSNFDSFWRTSSNLSELLQHELTCCPPNQMVRSWI
jgi:hypothetical protein